MAVPNGVGLALMRLTEGTADWEFVSWVDSGSVFIEQKTPGTTVYYGIWAVCMDNTVEYMQVSGISRIGAMMVKK